MKRIIAIIALTLGAAACSPTSPATWTCQEDMPCWDWRTMGNKIGCDADGICIDGRTGEVVPRP